MADLLEVSADAVPDEVLGVDGADVELPTNFQRPTQNRKLLAVLR